MNWLTLGDEYESKDTEPVTVLVLLRLSVIVIDTLCDVLLITPVRKLLVLTVVAVGLPTTTLDTLAPLPAEGDTAMLICEKPLTYNPLLFIHVFVL